MKITFLLFLATLISVPSFASDKPKKTKPRAIDQANHALDEFADGLHKGTKSVGAVANDALEKLDKGIHRAISSDPTPSTPPASPPPQDNTER